MAGSDAAFAYHEPAITTILNQTGLLLALNLVNACLDKLLYCGLIGQLFIGILWGTPGAKWLDRETETVIQQLGYLGLIMLIYEGGLSTTLSTLRANLNLSIAVAFTGIGAPMGLSFILMEMFSITPLQAFAAGAALSATSLGTTFTILSTTQLITTRLGTVTTSAAMLDDVVGLVMVQIITNLGGSSDSFGAVTVIRPVFVSIGFAVGTVLLCKFCFKPILKFLLARRDKMPKFMGSPHFAFLAYTSVLVGLVAGATYAGTSSLFAAYIAGVMASWFDDFSRQTLRADTTQTSDPSISGAGQDSTSSDSGQDSVEGSRPVGSSTAPLHEAITGKSIYECYYQKPASIGFAIPITEMFQGSVVWRGFVYAILMAFGKLVTGAWLVQFSSGMGLGRLLRALKSPMTSCIQLRKVPLANEKDTRQTQRGQGAQTNVTESTNQPSQCFDSDNQGGAVAAPSKNTRPPEAAAQIQTQPASTALLPPKPKSLYPASILGLAMVARGEIGYLIASLAESKGIFSDSSSTGSSETYLVIIWAISLCTLIGPICVGTLVKRVKTLQQNRISSGGPDPLGVWGI